MKRSGMIQHIYYILASNHPINSSDYEKIAEEILDEMEEIGMLPPVRSYLASGEAIGGAFRTTSNSWDPE